LDARLGGRVRRDVSSAELTTYRCGGLLSLFVRADAVADLVVVADAVRATGVPVLVVGRGSNLLVADRGFAGVAVTLGGEFEQLESDGDRARVRAGGAVPLPVLARRAAAAGVAGLEFFVGIPGSVGGAVRMNAGGHGADTDEVIVTARVVDLGDGTAREMSRAELGLGYRQSALSPLAVVVGAEFAGRGDDPAACNERVDEIVRWRREHQPGGQNAGSVFTNPPGDAAGRLIEAAGCKGVRVGGAVVSEKHANFFVAEPGARAGDVYALVELVQQRVEASSGVHLEPELRCIGFPESR
ncbi:MAG: UDP-N-acetylmuramate dehydrogenase, partial [Actinomycetota bacterium]|nr:UDP-N-acetylmuramate dehydrogenase [Actinomycetota bacterium]